MEGWRLLLTKQCFVSGLKCRYCDSKTNKQMIGSVGAKRLGKLIQEIRETEGMNLRDFAALCVKESGESLGHSTLAKVERAEMVPSDQTLRSIARNKFVAERYSLPELQNILQGVDAPIEREAATAQEVLPLAMKIDEIQRLKLVTALMNTLSYESKRKLLNETLDSITKFAV